MKKNTNTQHGLGLLAAIVIIAVVGVGGYAIYDAQVENKVQVEISEEETQEEMMEIRTEAQQTLLSVRQNLQLNTQTGVDVATGELADLEAEIDQSFDDVSSEAQADLMILRNDVSGLRAEIQASSVDTTSNLEADFDVFIENLENAFLELGSDIEFGVDVLFDPVSDESMDDDPVMTEEESMDDNNTTTEAEVDGEVGLTIN